MQAFGAGVTTTRSLANLFCSTCREVTQHDYNVCPRCATPNNSSARAPIPRPHGYGAMKAKQFDASMAEQGAARRRARIARHQIQRGVAKC